MQSLSIVLMSCLALALAAPQQSPYVVLPSHSGQQYTLTSRPQGFSIETGAAASRAAAAPVVAAVQPVAVHHVAAAPVAVRTAAVQPAYYSSQAAGHYAAAAAQQAAARKSVVVSQPAPIHYAPIQFSADSHYDQSSAAAAFAAKQSAAAAAQRSAAQYSSAAVHSAQIYPSANIVRQQQDISDDGSSFTYGFESDNGIAVQSQGQLKVYGPEQAGHSVSGSYSYVGDDGQTYTVNYVADETGFHASGAHLPQMSEEIARSIEYNLAHPEEWTQK